MYSCFGRAPLLPAGDLPEESEAGLSRLELTVVRGGRIRVTIGLWRSIRAQSAMRPAKKISRPPRAALSSAARLESEGYLSWVDILLNVPLSAEPTESTEATITIEMPAAIRPYSIAVAPDSSFRNAQTLDM